MSFALTGNHVNVVERELVMNAPAASPLVSPLFEAKCRDVVLNVIFPNIGAGQNISEIALGDAADGSDAQPLDLVPLAPLLLPAQTRQVYTVLLKDVCRKYIRVTTTGASGGDVLIYIERHGCRDHSAINNDRTTGNTHISGTIACTCP